MKLKQSLFNIYMHYRYPVILALIIAFLLLATIDAISPPTLNNIKPQAFTIPENPSLRDPSYAEALYFIQQDTTDQNEYITGVYDCDNFARDTAVNAAKCGLICLPTIVFSPDGLKAHAIVAFNTTDFGLQYFEPQTDEYVENPTAMDIWGTNSPYLGILHTILYASATALILILFYIIKTRKDD